MKQAVLFSLALGVIFAAAAAAQPDSSVTRDGRYWVQTTNGVMTTVGVGRVRVITEGNVTVRGVADGSSTYSIKERVQARDGQQAGELLRTMEVKTRTQGDWLYFIVTLPRHGAIGSDLSLSLPRNMREVWVETRGGNVRATDFDGVVRTESVAGQIDVDRIQSSALLRTGGGDVHIGRVGGGVRCYSGAGTIRAESAGGESWLETAGGEIFVRDASGPLHATTAGGNIKIDRAASTVFARTAAGLIEVQQAGGAVTAESSGGAIQVNAAKGVRCESASGAIRLRNVGGSVTASTAVGNILAELLSGNRIEDSTLTTYAGDITVFISSNIPITVLARNESAGTLGRIISDFPEIRVRKANSPGVSVVAEGTLNGGGPTLRINVMGGTIYLRREK